MARYFGLDAELVFLFPFLLSSCSGTRDLFLEQAMATAVEFLYLFYCLVSAVVFIVMSALAGTVLRSTKTQVSTHTPLKRACVSNARVTRFFPLLTGHCCHDNSAN